MVDIKKLDNFFSILNKDSKKISKIKYVALGDSFVAGHNSKIGFNTNGNLTKGEISGLGYPSFLASLLQKNSELSLEAYDNLALPLSNIDLWIALLTLDKKAIVEAQNIIDFIQIQDWNVSNPFKNFFTNYFNNWNIKKNDFKIIYDKVCEANFITLSIGIIDLVSNLPFGEIKHLMKANGAEKPLVLNKTLQLIENSVKKISAKFEILLKTLKKIAPKAKIVVVPYVKPLLFFENVIEDYFNAYIEKNDLSIFDYAFRMFDNMQRQIAANLNINYINTYDYKYFNKNINFLFENAFSFFPTEKGYKKVAMDLYTKLMINKDEITYQWNSSKIYGKYINSENKAYWQNDFSSYTQIFDVKTNNLKLFTKVYGETYNFNLFKNSNLENKYSGILNSYLNISIFIENFIRYYKKDISLLLKKFIDNKFPNNTKYKSLSSISSYLQDEQKSKEVVLTLLKNGKFEKFLFIAENKLKVLKNENTQITLKVLISVIKETLKTSQAISFDILKQILNSSILENEKETISKISYEFLKDCLQTNLLEKMFNIKLNEHYLNIRQYLSELKSFTKLSTFIVSSIANHASLYSPLNNYDDFFQKWITNNKYNLIYLLDKIFLEISSLENISKTVDFVYDTILVIWKINKIDGKNQRALKENLRKILLILKSNPKNLNDLFINFINKIKDFAIFDYVTKKRKQKNVFKVSKWIGVNNIMFMMLKLLGPYLKIKAIIRKNKNS